MQKMRNDTILRRAAIALIAAGCAAAQGADSLAAVAVEVSETGHAWPWIAMSAIAALVGVVAYASRRRGPFGK
jgi:MYXO-CTERM domain-containing protein